MRRILGEATVSDAMFGLWRRRSIHLRDGGEDPAKLVLWLQTASGMGDMRFPDDRVDLSHRDCLEACTSDELIALAQPSCSSGITTLDAATRPYPTAVWLDGERGVRYQPLVEFPEPGWFEWREEGTCMIEWAPSGSYEEDWRLEPDSRSRLLELYAVGAPTTTCLFVAGEHAMFVRDRACAVEEVRLTKLARACRDDHAALVTLLDCEFSYARQQDGPDSRFVIELSTLPFQEGRELPLDWLCEINPDASEVKAPDGQLWRIASWLQSADR